MTHPVHSNADHELIRVTVQLFPTPSQDATFRAWLAALTQANGALTTVLHGTTLRAGAPALTRDEIAYLLTLVSPALEASLPPSVWPSVISQCCTRFQRRRDSSASEPSLPLDVQIQAIGEMHVHVTGQPDLVVADLWRLPLGLTEALVCTGNDHVRAVQHQGHTLRTADTAGSPAALTQLHDLIRLHGPVIGRPPGHTGVHRTQPHRAQFADLTCQIGVDGKEIWLLTCTVRVPPGWLPRAHRQDTVGVDVGVRALVTWADATDAGQLLRTTLPVGDWRPQQPATLLSAAWVRRMQFERTQAGLDQVIRHLLTYRRVAIEQLAWRGLTAGIREAMTLNGVSSLGVWLTGLGRLTGTVVCAVNPAGTSVQCGQCGQRGVLQANRVFRCQNCGDIDRDTNAARSIRRVSLEGWT
ncbi:hypothetical protein E7T06_05220 [Deinococcus sp. Arct2-2]|uniref:zinc ribbon domain-containing protein n=1 Tax=Deinococcus sp. Arct2-2 TaxID=2568653 RepID=UPI0010A3D0FC|nr:zinc ribbon domain-containing protein [Deinococcus sp. Arct2-2]THF70957.1 hypothetical protein E7T06_05220 [Deinococcus sp. Arct2-2]